MLIYDRATCKKCGEGFGLEPSQMAHELCVPKLCPICKQGGKKCRHCGKTFVRLGRGMPTAFCSHQCRDVYQANYATRLAAEVAPQILLKHVCVGCDEEFESPRKKASRCPKCRVELTSYGSHKRTCEDCGEQFRSLRAKRCKACRALAERRRAAAESNLRYKAQERGVAALSLTAKVGRMGELLFDLYAARKCWLVSVPSEGNPGFDRIVCDDDGKLTRVQIKAVRGSRFASDCWDLGGGERRLIRAMFDALAVVDVDSGFIWLVPEREFTPGGFYTTNYHAEHALYDTT